MQARSPRLSAQSHFTLRAVNVSSFAFTFWGNADGCCVETRYNHQVIQVKYK